MTKKIIYTRQLISDTEYPLDKTYRKKVIGVTKNGIMTPKNVIDNARKILKLAQSQNKAKPKILIHGMTPLGIRTISGYGSDLSEIGVTIENYLSGRVEDSTKFLKFSSVRFTVIY